MNCLENLDTTQDNRTVPSVDVTIFDGAALVNMLRPGAAKTFSDYAHDIFIPYISSHLQNVSRVDIVGVNISPTVLR